MKKIFTLLTAACIGSFAFGQTLFQSNLSSWASGNPTDFMNTARTNIASTNVVQKSIGATYGTSMASLINTSTSSHKRFVTDAFTVVGGQSYLVEMWVAAQDSGELRTNYYDVTNSAYGTYNPYIDVAAVSNGALVKISQVVTVPSTCTSAEFILSLKSTPVATAQAPFEIGIILDSIAITTTTPPTTTIKKIYDIQYTTAPSGDSPEMGNVVTTRGIITGIVKNGPDRHAFFIQDSALAWNGLYIYERNDSTLVIGDSVEVTGTVAEFNGTTELTFVSNITVLNSGNTLPVAVTNTTLNANKEEWEGVLIKVTNAQCTNTTGGFGIWEINDGSGVLKADDDIFFYHTTAVVGTNYDVRGIGHYSFGDFKILPRDFNDISLSTSTGMNEIEKNKVNVYPNPANNVLNFELNISTATVQLFDITGKTLKSINTNNNNFSVSLSDFNNGIYFYSIMDAEGKKIATNRFVVAK
jgi:DNA/RNA endonuclease YhcR with UshA esterase domain